MSVTHVAEMKERRQSTYRQGKLTNLRVFLVTCSIAADGPATARMAAGVPRVGDSHPIDSGCAVESIDVLPHQNSDLHFEVAVEYSDDVSLQKGNLPPDAPPTYTYGGSLHQEKYFVDEAGNKVLNSAGDRLDPLPEREVAELTINVTRQEQIFDAMVAAGFNNTVNKDAVTIDATTYPAGTLRMLVIEATSKTDANTGDSWYEVKYPIKYKPDGWGDEFEDRGANQIKDDDPSAPWYRKPRPILDGAGQPLQTKDWPLDGKGHALPHADDDPAKLDFQPYRAEWWLGLFLE